MKKYKLHLTCLLAAVFLLTAVVSPVLAAAPFPDIKGHWARADIEQFAAKGYIKGYPDGTFQPERSISRAEFIAILINCLGIQPKDTSSSCFQDVGKDYWALPSINAAVQKGIILPKEYPTGLLPTGAITRSETAAMMVRALGKDPDYSALPFKDQDQLAKSMYRGYIKTAYNEGILAGCSDGEFKPFATVTRAQACTMLTRLLERLDQKQTTPPVETNPQPNLPASSLTSVVVNGNSFDLWTTPVVFKTGLSEVTATTISTTGQAIVVNNLYRFPLNTTKDNPDVVVGNARYVINSLGVDGKSLVVYPTTIRKIYKLNLDGYKYNADYIKLYIGNALSDCYLADMELLGESTVKINDKTYDLTTNKIAIEVNDRFYRLTGFVFTETDTKPTLVEIDPVAVDEPGIDDILAIFDGINSIDPNSISQIDFLIAGERYKMSDVVIDASGNFTIIGGTKIYPISDVTMVIDGNYYQLDEVKLQGGKFIFYCTKNKLQNWVVINDHYYNSKDVEIIKDGTIYPIEDVLVVSKNIVRIDGRQYDLDSSIRCRYNGNVYDIKHIDFDPYLEVITIDVRGLSDYQEISRPDQYRFYYRNDLYHKGTDDVSIYVDGRWRGFNEVTITDPTYFKYKNISYKLIGARIEIEDREFTISDAIWRGKNRTFEIYLDR